MQITTTSRSFPTGGKQFSLRSSLKMGFRDLYKPTLAYRLGLIWLILDPFLISAIYGFLIVVVRGNFQGWSILLGVLTLHSINRSISPNVSARLSTEPFPLMHTSTSQILVSKFVTGAIQGLLMGIAGSAVISLFTEFNALLFFHLPIICVLLSLFGVSIGLLFSPLNTLFKDIEKIVSYILLLSLFLQAVLYSYQDTSGMHRAALSILPHTLGVEWLRSLVGNTAFPFSMLHCLKVTLAWSLICIFSISRINRARWRLTTWD
tara:strand:+ start:5452 stop:6240 length:789 start_codon:yes stop_codon:yes gene_type:complete